MRPGTRQGEQGQLPSEIVSSSWRYDDGKAGGSARQLGGKRGGKERGVGCGRTTRRAASSRKNTQQNRNLTGAWGGVQIVFAVPPSDLRARFQCPMLFSSPAFDSSLCGFARPLDTFITPTFAKATTTTSGARCGYPLDGCRVCVGARSSGSEIATAPKSHFVEMALRRMYVLL